MGPPSSPAPAGLGSKFCLWRGPGSEVWGVAHTIALVAVHIQAPRVIPQRRASQARPQVPHHVRPHQGPILPSGIVLCVEGASPLPIWYLTQPLGVQGSIIQVLPELTLVMALGMLTPQMNQVQPSARQGPHGPFEQLL